jgi:tight adherence protein C
MLEVLVCLTQFSAVFLLVWALFRFPVPAELPIHRRIAVALGTDRRQTLFEQPALAPLLALAMTVSRRLSFPVLRQLVHHDLNGSGNPNNYDVDEYVALCLGCAALMGVLSAALVAVVVQEFEPLTPLVMLLVGFALPLWTLHEAAARRVMRISKKLPYTLDLIALMMAAGSTFTEAVAALIRDEPNDDFNQELRLVQAEIEFGTPRAAALQNMGDRIRLETLRSIVGAVNQAEALGTPLSVILKNQSGMLRMHRSVRAEKLSASASLRILFPSMIILLAVVLIVFGPLLIKWIESGFSLTLG